MSYFIDDVQILVTEIVLAEPYLHTAIPSLTKTSFACQETVMKWHLEREPLDLTRPPPESLWWLLSSPKL